MFNMFNHVWFPKVIINPPAPFKGAIRLWDFGLWFVHSAVPPPCMSPPQGMKSNICYHASPLSSYSVVPMCITKWSYFPIDFRALFLCWFMLISGGFESSLGILFETFFLEFRQCAILEFFIPLLYIIHSFRGSRIQKIPENRCFFICFSAIDFKAPKWPPRHLPGRQKPPKMEP